MNDRSGYFWYGNVCDPPTRLVTDGHVMLLLAACDPLVAGILAEWWEDEEDFAGQTVPAKRVPHENCEANWNATTRSLSVGAVLMETRRSLAGPLLRLHRADGRDAWMRPHVVALVTMAVTYDRITQQRDNQRFAQCSPDLVDAADPLGAVVFWNLADPVAIAMPCRPRANDGDMLERTIVTLDTLGDEKPIRQRRRATAAKPERTDS